MLAERHVNAVDADVSNLARAVFVHHRHFFTFVYEEGVEPTNNRAEGTDSDVAAVLSSVF